MTRWWLILSVLAAPLAIVPDAGLAETKNLVFLVLGAGAAIVLVGNPWVRGFAGWTAGAAILTGGERWAVRGALGVLAWVLFYHLASTLTETGWRKVRLAVAASAAFQVIWLGVQALGLDPIFHPLPSQGGVTAAQVGLSGWFGNPMDLALYLALALPLVAAVHPWLAGGIALAMLTALHVTVGALGVVVTAIWLGLRSHPPGWLRAALVVAVLGAAGAYLWSYDPQGAGLKPLVWGQAVALIREKPWLGWGPNALDHSVFILTPQVANYWNFVFNEWLQGALELGVAAPLLAAGFLGSLLWRLRGRVEQAAELVPALVILVAASLFSIPFRIGPVALLAALTLGQLDRRLA